jgi:hypothetical protein
MNSSFMKNRAFSVRESMGFYPKSTKKRRAIAGDIIPDLFKVFGGLG